MVNFSLKFVKLILNGEAQTVDVKHSAEVAFTAEIQEALKNTVWRSGCHSWYYTEDGWNSTVYPYTQVDFWRRCAFPKWDDWNITYTSKGTAKIRRTKALRFLTVALAVVGAYKVRQSGLGLQDLKAVVKNFLQGYVARIFQLWALLKSQVV